MTVLNLVKVATPMHLHVWLTQSMIFHDWYANTRYKFICKMWKQAVDAWRRQLKQLDRLNCFIVNDAVLNVVAKSCPGLHTLDIGILPRVYKGDSIMFRSVKATAAALQAVATGCPRLRRVNLSTRFQILTDPIMDDKVLPFANCCHHLSYLDVRECRIGINVLRRLAEKCPGLQHLDLNGCGEGITDDGILMIAKSCLQLRFLDISSCKCSTGALQRPFPELRQLNVCNCGMSRNDVWTAVLRNCPQIEQVQCRN